MQPREVTARLLLAKGVRDAVCLLGVRGYYRDSMGVVGANDRALWDDAIFLTSPTCHVAFNANVDPSIYRPGVAVLEPGLWFFRINVHGKSKPPELQYDCLEQHGPVTVRRDGKGLDTGMFAIQIHRGGMRDTASLGCQTIIRDQWDAFIATVKDQLRRYGQRSIPYLLIEYQG